MDVFVKVEGSLAITRHPKGILRQSELYARGKDVFIKIGSGFTRIMPKFGDKFPTGNTDITILEFEGENVVVDTQTGAVQYAMPLALVKTA